MPTKPRKPSKISKTNKTRKPPKASTASKATPKAGHARKPAPAAKATPEHGKTLTLGNTNATTATVLPAPDGTTTLRLQRTIKAPAERIYQCFLDPDAYAKWLPPHGFTGKVHAMEAKVGGSFRMSFSTINRGWTHFFNGTYRELVPNRRIVHTDRFEDPAMGAGEMTVTIDLEPVKGGTRLSIVQSGIPAGPAGDGAPYGWSQSLDNLAALCEQELPF